MMKGVEYWEEEVQNKSWQTTKPVHPQKTLSLPNLPSDIVHIIFSHLTTSDLKNLSVLSKQFRHLLVPFLLSQVKTVWYKLVEESEGQTRFLKQFKYVITQLRIADAFSYGEWQVDIFQDALYQLPRLQHLSINTANSSGWLRYRSNDTITQLTLYTDPTVKDTQARLQPNSKGIVTREPSINSIKMFNIEHLANFKMVQKLELGGYHLSWDPQSIVVPVLTLKSLTLVDCYWDYPFQLKNFNYNNTLTHLGLRFKGGSTFLYSERFRDFIFNIGQDKGLESIESLDLIHEVKTETEHQSGQLSVDESFLKRVLSGTGLPSLKSLVLKGWRVNCIFYWHRMVEILQSKQDLRVVEFDVVSSFGSGINIGVVKGWCMEMCPWITVKLSLRELEKG
ncbi:hypothetical protein CANMA_003289 [Candida margitis]|uniref:uncharacterized protein n=1 Tax=Candida margitis TaxID=1775924 RepID=UPI0022268D36|nr:uncharacterized protein CANMA_003289 [Candida margitis]KAI5966043.1 hypothetical protein CANMA_003289 [Candida margitis]